MKNFDKLTLLNIVTSSQSTIFFRGNLKYMKKKGFDVWACSSPGTRLRNLSEEEDINTVEILMEREISPLKDLISLWQLIRLMKRLKPSIVNAGTPKAGFLGMLAAILSGVPIRIYQQRGLRLETTNGIKRLILFCIEWLTCRCAVRVVCNSLSLCNQMIALRLSNREKLKVLGNGSSGGINTSHFYLNADILNKSIELKKQYSIPSDVPVIGFIGRLVRDKGISELCSAFKRILIEFPSARLLIIGQTEAGDSVNNESLEWLTNHSNVIFTGFVNDTVPYYPIFDVIAFPSYREGFPNVLLEAAAMQVAVVGFCSTGVIDAVQDSVTGLLVPQGDVYSLTQALYTYLRKPLLRRKHGSAGRERVVRDFQPYRIWELLYQEYITLIKSNGLPAPCPTEVTIPSYKLDNEQEQTYWAIIRHNIFNGEPLELLASEYEVNMNNIRSLLKLIRH